MAPSTVSIIGQGYVGMPLAQAAVATGWTVHGLDRKQSLVDALNAGISHVDDLSNDEVAEMVDAGYRATTDATVIGESDVVVICVPTPLAEAGSPDLSAVEAASRVISEHLTAGTTVILESTTYPGTTDHIVKPILEEGSSLSAGTDFHLAYSPERVDPGSTTYGIRNTPKLVGGLNDPSTLAAADFYRTFVEEVVPMDGTKEAETAKLLENTFRHVNIALMNEMAKCCKELDIDVWEVIRGAATKPFGFMKFTPGPGVGGHCIPIDPNYLSYEVRKQLGYPFRFVELAEEINSSMPQYVVSRVTQLLNSQKKAVNGASVLLLGVTYKADIADQRESPAIPVAALLQANGADVRFHDPMVETWHLPDRDLHCIQDFDREVAAADLVIVLQTHSSYDLAAIAERARLVLDTRGQAPDPAERL